MKLVKGLENTNDGKATRSGEPRHLFPMQGLLGAVGVQLDMQTALQWPEGRAGTHRAL